MLVAAGGLQVLKLFVLSILSAGLFASSGVAVGEPEHLSARELTRMLTSVQKPAKPGTSGVSGDDSCVHADDFECDEPGLGTGACPAGTDYSDCWRVMTGQEDNSCQWANDGECDEPRFGTGVCTQGTDRADCGDLSGVRFHTDSCDLAFNDVCDHPGEGTGLCAARTDRSDCAGRDRPLSFDDHFFGHDDRVLLDTSVEPWRSVGTVTMDAGGTCTATLIAETVILTAAHCIEDESGRVNARAEFAAGSGERARVIDYLTSPERAAAIGSDRDDPLDWALLRLDRPLGAGVGVVPPLALKRDRGERAALRARLYQAGYSWDTGDNLSGNVDCRIVGVYEDNTFAHECDTTQGDSGSPFLVREDGSWHVVGSDSTYRRVPDGPVINIAVGSEAWIDRFAAFQAGETGMNGTRARAGGKPVVARKPD